MNREYESAYLLVSSIATDCQMRQEEQQIFDLMHSAQHDCHPDAHACRVKIALAVLESPVTCPWGVREESAK